MATKAGKAVPGAKETQGDGKKKGEVETEGTTTTDTEYESSTEEDSSVGTSTSEERAAGRDRDTGAARGRREGKEDEGESDSSDTLDEESSTEESGEEDTTEGEKSSELSSSEISGGKVKGGGVATPARKKTGQPRRPQATPTWEREEEEDEELPAKRPPPPRRARKQPVVARQLPPAAPPLAPPVAPPLPDHRLLKLRDLNRREEKATVGAVPPPPVRLGHSGGKGEPAKKEQTKGTKPKISGKKSTVRSATPAGRRSLGATTATTSGKTVLNKSQQATKSQPTIGNDYPPTTAALQPKRSVKTLPKKASGSRTEERLMNVLVDKSVGKKVTAKAPITKRPPGPAPPPTKGAGVQTKSAVGPRKAAATGPKPSGKVVS